MEINVTKKLVDVLILDDDDVSNFIYKKIIESSGIANEIVTFQKGRLALEYLIERINVKEGFPDMIFIDINMPVMNGWDFLDEYKEKVAPKVDKFVFISMLSSSVYKEDIQKAQSYEVVNEYISKPLTQESVAELIAKYFPQ